MTQTDGLRSANYEIFCIGAISVRSVPSIVTLVLLYGAQDDNISTVLEWIDVLLSVIFLIDFTFGS